MNGEILTTLLQSAVASLQRIISVTIAVSEPEKSSPPLIPSEMCALIGITGDVRCRMVMEASCETYSNLAASMYGMSMEEEMLQSFAGEIANMIAGNTAILASETGLHMDITLPTLLLGSPHIYGFDHAAIVSLSVDRIGSMKLVMLMNEKEAA